MSNRTGNIRKTTKMTLLTWLIGILWTMQLTGCFTTTGKDVVAEYNQTPLTVSIPSNLSPEQVKEAMVRTFIGREWQVEQQSLQEVVATLNHRSYQAKATFKVENGVIKILSDSRYNSKPVVPEAWLENLQKDLSKRLTTAGS